MKIICVTGSVGTGKTYVSKKLAKSLKYKYIDVNKIIRMNKLYDEYDKKNKCYVVDIKKLNKFLINLIKDSKECGLTIDSHLSHFLPKKYVDLCIVTSCDIKILAKRLKKRKYSKSKLADNLEVEIFSICLFESKKKKHNVLLLNTNNKFKLDDVVNYIKKL